MEIQDLEETVRALLDRLNESEDPAKGAPAGQAGRLIGLLRRRLGLKQWELARLAETRQSFVSKVERGKGVQLETLLRLAEAMGYELWLVPRERRPAEDNSAPAGRRAG